MICIPINIVEKDYNYTKRPNPVIYNPYTSSLYTKMLGNMDGNYISCNNYNTQEDIEKTCNNDSNCIGYNYQNTGVNGVYKPKCLKNKFNLSNNENMQNQYNYSDYNYVYYSKPVKINQQKMPYKLTEEQIQENKKRNEQQHYLLTIEPKQYEINQKPKQYEINQKPKQYEINQKPIKPIKPRKPRKQQQQIRI